MASLGQYLALICTFLSVANSMPADNNDDVIDLTILHVNDIHSHFEENNKYGGRCNEALHNNGSCYGGQARMLTKVREIRDNHPNKENIIFLNAGDFYTGTIWYEEFKYQGVMDFSNMLNYTAAALGNHDFDDENEGLNPFIDGANFTLLAANLDHDDDSTMPINSKRSIIKHKGGISIGIIGYVTTATPFISKPGKNLRFLDEIQSVQAEATYLKNIENVDFIIALGHSGYEVDMELAKNVPEVDLVVGGHSHTFLWPENSDEEPVDTSRGPYPTYIEQANGKVVPVVQAYCYSKYLGYFNVHISPTGGLVTPVDSKGVTDAKPILLDSSVEEDQDFVKILKDYRKNLTKYDEVVGETNTFLICGGQKECNLGNLIADAMVYSWNDGNEHNRSLRADMAFQINGGIRSNIMEGDIVVEDLWNTMPFGDTFDILNINGTGIRTVLEAYASDLCPDQSCYATSFTQVSSSLKIEYEITSDNIGSRIKSIRTSAHCGDDEDWCDLGLDTVYTVAMSTYMAEGGLYRCMDKYKGNEITFNTVALNPVPVPGKGDIESLQAFITEKCKNGPLNYEVEGRLNYTYILPNSGSLQLNPKRDMFSMINIILGLTFYIIHNMY